MAAAAVGADSRPTIPLDSARAAVHRRRWPLVVAMLCGLAPALRDVARRISAACCRRVRAARRRRAAARATSWWSSRWRCRSRCVACRRCSIQSLLAVQQVPLGFDPSNVLTLQFRLPATKYSKPEDIARFFKSAIEKVRAMPGVSRPRSSARVPFSGNGGRHAGTPSTGGRRDAGAEPQAGA